MTLENLGRLILKKRGGRGIRAVAKEIGVSPSTLSRVENGHLPDLENYRKICAGWASNPPASSLIAPPRADRRGEGAFQEGRHGAPGDRHRAGGTHSCGSTRCRTSGA